MTKLSVKEKDPSVRASRMKGSQLKNSRNVKTVGHPDAKQVFSAYGFNE